MNIYARIKIYSMTPVKWTLTIVDTFFGHKAFPLIRHGMQPLYCGHPPICYNADIPSNVYAIHVLTSLRFQCSVLSLSKSHALIMYYQGEGRVFNIASPVEICSAQVFGKGIGTCLLENNS